MLELGAAVGSMLEGADGELFSNRLERKALPVTAHNNNKIIKTVGIRMNWKPELDDLARREAFAREMGGVDKVKRQRDQGRLTVRERIDKLVDPRSFHEVGAVSGTAEYHESGDSRI